MYLCPVTIRLRGFGRKIVDNYIYELILTTTRLSVKIGGFSGFIAKKKIFLICFGRLVLSSLCLPACESGEAFLEWYGI